MLNIPSMSGPLGAQVLTHWANDHEKLKNQQHQAPSSNQNILCWTNGSCIETGPSKDTGGYVL